ncbi:MAG: hypothetical protein WCC04_06940 [Terriglobales bacterium]
MAEAEENQGYDYEAFDNMSDEDQLALIDDVDEIKAMYIEKMVEAEVDVFAEARRELNEVVEKYGYDRVKSYLDGQGNGFESYNSSIDLNSEIEELV